MTATQSTLPGTGGSGWRPRPGPPAREPAPGTSERSSRRTLLRSSRRARLLAALALTVACALAVPLLATSLASKPTKALAAARDLPPGTTITAADLAVVTASGPSGALVSAAQESALIGRSVRAEVPAGALLDDADLGSFPPAGSSIVPVAVKPGQYPANLQTGQSVEVFPIPSGDAATQPELQQSTASGTVTQMAPVPEDGSGQMVIDLEVSDAAAPAIAQAPAVVLVELNDRGGNP